MRKIEYILIFFCCLLLQACPESCDDKQVGVAVQNDTEDKLYCALCYGFSTLPFAHYNFFEISSYSKTTYGTYSMNQIKSEGLSVWVVKEKTVEKYGWDSVIKNQLYDSVLKYSWDRLSEKNFVIKIDSFHYEE